MEVLGGQQCMKEVELGNRNVQLSSAHHVFDKMPNPLEVYEEDILLVMNEEKVTRGEAIHLLQEELMNAHRRFEEKLDRLLGAFGVTGDMACKNSEEISVSISEPATTTEAATSLSPMASPPPTPTKYLTECLNSDITCEVSGIDEEHPLVVTLEPGDGENKVCAHYIGTHDNSMPVPTMCSMLSLNVNVVLDQAMVVFLTTTSVFEIVSASVASGGYFLPWKNVDMKPYTPMLIMCSNITIYEEKWL
uniref:Uncharacterized protein n=1 Tax=Leersia perrieri TaxID=77586 RepID=A0A0D9XDK3_9ORYZ